MCATRLRTIRISLQRLLEDGLTLLDMSVSPHRLHKDYHRKTPSEVIYKVGCVGVGMWLRVVTTLLSFSFFFSQAQLPAIGFILGVVVP